MCNAANIDKHWNPRGCKAKQKAIKLNEGLQKQQQTFMNFFKEKRDQNRQ